MSAPVTIVHALTFDAMIPFAELAKNAGPGEFPPGVSIVTAPREIDATVVVWAAQDGNAKGIATMFHQDGEGARSGDISIGVQDAYRRRGIASALLDKLCELHEVNFSRQLCTADGYKFLSAYLKKRGMPFVQRFQTEAEFVATALSILPQLPPKIRGIVGSRLTHWLKTSPQPHTSGELSAAIETILTGG